NLKEGRLAGKAAVITGAASGIGRASALRFAAEGARLILADSQEPDTETLKTGCFVRTDVSRRPDNERMIDECVMRYGRIDILFCNSAVTPLKFLPDSTNHDID